MKNYFMFLFCWISLTGFTQTQKPDLQDKSLWTVTGRSITYFNEGGKRGITFDEREGNGLMVLNQGWFREGTIEFDVKGRNVPQKSFVGFAFQVQNDSTYEAIYFRPFNFINPDTLRRPRSVQYICLPRYDWSKLRTDHPGKYENKINPVPVPDEWFHIKLVVEGLKVSAYINNSSTPSLMIDRLSTPGNGKIGFWVGNGSDGSFANLAYTSKID